MATSKKLPLQDARRMTLGMDGAWDVYRKLLWEVANYRDAAARKVPIGEGAAEEIRWPMYWAITLYYNVTAAGPGYVDFARVHSSLS